MPTASPPSETVTVENHSPPNHMTKVKPKNYKKQPKTTESTHDHDFQQNNNNLQQQKQQHHTLPNFAPKKENFDKLHGNLLYQMQATQRFFSAPLVHHQPQPMPQFPLPTPNQHYHHHHQQQLPTNPYIQNNNPNNSSNNNNSPFISSEQVTQAKAFQEYIASTIANLKQNNTFNTLLKHISEISSLKQQQHQHQQQQSQFPATLKKELAASSTSTSVLSSSSSSSSTTSSIAKLEKKSLPCLEPGEFMCDEITADSPDNDTDTNNFSNEDFSNEEEYEEEEIQNELLYLPTYKV